MRMRIRTTTEKLSGFCCLLAEHVSGDKVMKIMNDWLEVGEGVWASVFG